MMSNPDQPTIEYNLKSSNSQEEKDMQKKKQELMKSLEDEFKSK